MKILVTGGAGFIGSHVADAYVQAGHEVAILDNLSSGREEYVPKGVRLYEGDITDLQRVEAVLQEFRPEVINHHAAHIQVGYSVQNPQFDAQNNILGLLNIMETARKVGGVQKLIMASTGGAMYGDKEVPFVETMDPQPVSPYGISKRSGELYLHFYLVQYGIPYVVLRYANVYGPRQNPHGESGVIAIFMEKLLKGEQPKINGTGENTRDYVYVADVARANLAALEYASSGIFNIGTSVETSTKDIAQRVYAALGVEGEIQHGPERPGEQKRSALNFSLAQQELHWKPSMSLDEGIVLTAQSMHQPTIL